MQNSFDVLMLGDEDGMVRDEVKDFLLMGRECVGSSCGKAFLDFG